jgi:cytochrome c peroxidase
MRSLDSHGSLWLVLGLLLPPLSPALLVAQERAPHGALGFAQQQAQLDTLKLLTSGAVPSGVDAPFWRHFAPQADTAAQVALGRKLYFDPRLSADDSVSCATCHDVSRSFTDLRPVSEGIGGKLGRRNAPTTMNAALITPLFWDGRSDSLAHQAGQPVMNPIEMGMADRDAVVGKLAKTGDYPSEFQTAFGRAIDYAGIENAIAAFERTLIFLDAPFDRWQAGDTKAMPAQAVRGHTLFMGKARCASCHPLNATNPLGTDFRFHNIGVSAKDKNFEKLAGQALQVLAKDSSEQALDQLALATDMSELGRFVVTKNYADIGSFRTPQLRNVSITGPYMHDGSMQTLWDVVDHYNKGGEGNPWLDGGMEALALTEDEITDLVSFLAMLTDHRFAAQDEAEDKRQSALAKTQRPFRDEALAMRKKLTFEDRMATGGK